MNAAATDVVVRDLGRELLRDTWQKMKVFTEQRGPTAPDEIWFVEHPPVFTLGLAGDSAHILDPGDIDIVQTDRGGQVTYHGPGQLVSYVLLDLRRRGINIRELVEMLESSVIELLASFGIESCARRDAPGVYVDGSKIAALGLRVRRGCTYHGLAFNVAMDLEPFSRINPCGFENLPVTQLSALSSVETVAEVKPVFAEILLRLLAD